MKKIVCIIRKICTFEVLRTRAAKPSNKGLFLFNSPHHIPLILLPGFTSARVLSKLGKFQRFFISRFLTHFKIYGK